MEAAYGLSLKGTSYFGVKPVLLSLLVGRVNVLVVVVAVTKKREREREFWQH